MIEKQALEMINEEIIEGEMIGGEMIEEENLSII